MVEKVCLALRGTQLRATEHRLLIRDHAVLPAIRHSWTHSALTPARKAGTRDTYPGGMKGWVDQELDASQ